MMQAFLSISITKTTFGEVRWCAISPYGPVVAVRTAPSGASLTRTLQSKVLQYCLKLLPSAAHKNPTHIHNQLLKPGKRQQQHTQIHLHKHAYDPIMENLYAQATRPLTLRPLPAFAIEPACKAPLTCWEVLQALVDGADPSAACLPLWYSLTPCMKASVSQC